jgi:hypothetical protein
LLRPKKEPLNGLGNASVKRDKVLSNAILELAETRAMPGHFDLPVMELNYTGFEEVGREKI